MKRNVPEIVWIVLIVLFLLIATSVRFNDGGCDAGMNDCGWSEESGTWAK